MGSRRIGPAVAGASLLVVVAALAVANLQAGPSSPASPGAGRPGYAPSIISADAGHDVSPPLRQLPPAAWSTGQGADDQPLMPGVHTVTGADGAIQRAAATVAAPAPTVNVLGVGNGFTGPQGAFSVTYAPPDTNAAVGLTQVVELVNSGFAVFDKSGHAIYGPVATRTLWSGFGGLCQSDNDGDGIVTYDQLANRWIISQFAVTGANGSSTPFLQCVAVSTSSDATGTWYRYSFPYSQFPDYPKLSVWPDAYYETFNMFSASGSTFQGGQVCAPTTAPACWPVRRRRSSASTSAPATGACLPRPFPDRPRRRQASRNTSCPSTGRATRTRSPGGGSTSIGRRRPTPR